MKLKLGPLLGIEAENDYTVCFTTDKSIASAAVTVEGQEVLCSKVAELPDGFFWRGKIVIPAPEGIHGRKLTYEITINGETANDPFDRSSWSFYVPGLNEKPLIAYTSCNGVSRSDLITKIENPFALWKDMEKSHNQKPFSLLLMGGDQIYADSIWDKVSDLNTWSALKREEQESRSLTKSMASQIDGFYSKLYIERWRDPTMSLLLASIPSAMMWDDHDIFDGWGSFPKRLQECDVFQGIFHYAKKYFDLYQLRTRDNSTLLSRDANHSSFHFSFRGYHILGLDNRSERSIFQVMSDNNWDDTLDKLSEIDEGNLIVMSAVPIVYRDFSLTESAFEITPWAETLEDDLKDHWRAKEHQGERTRLIMNLLNNARNRSNRAQSKNDENPSLTVKYRTLILSGDVHVGCMGVITDKSKNSTVKIHQVVSSGIVHPSPSLVEWLGIRAVTNDDNESLNEDGTIEARIIKPFGSDKYIRSRNYATIDEGTDNKIWVNWITENDDAPAYPID